VSNILIRLADKLTQPGSTGWGNCYLALLLYITKGGYLVFRRSTGHPAIPHVMWAPTIKELEVQHFLPITRRYGWRAIACSPLFKGRWFTQKIGDKE
jgi:hypothetical protein